MRLPLARFARSRRLRLVNSQLLVAGARLGRRAAPLGQRQYPEHAHPPWSGKRDDAADAHLLARLFDALAVDADVACCRSRAWARVRLFTSRMQNRKRSILTVFVELRQLGEGVGAGAAAFGRAAGGGRASSRRRRRGRSRLRPSAARSPPRRGRSRSPSAASTGSSPPAERTLRAWLASRSARSMRSQLRPRRR